MPITPNSKMWKDNQERISKEFEEKIDDAIIQSPDQYIIDVEFKLKDYPLSEESRSRIEAAYRIGGWSTTEFIINEGQTSSWFRLIAPLKDSCL